MLSRYLDDDKSAAYKLLPSNTHHLLTHANNSRSLRNLIGNRSWKRLGALALLSVFAVAYFRRRKTTEVMDTDPYHGLPTYDAIKVWEDKLPQHDPNLPWPEGKDGRFVKFEVPYNEIGFNNQLQDILLTAQIAYMANRAYAFQPYLWDEWAKTPVLKINGHWRSSVIPLNAFISGPAAGGAFPPGSGKTPDGGPAAWAAPRGVTYGYYEKVCPPERRKFLSIQGTRKKYGLTETDESPTGKEILEAFGKELLAMNETCVIVGDEHIFTFKAFGKRVVPAYEIVKDSPILTNFTWSPLVRNIVARNLPLIVDSSRWENGSPARLEPAKNFPGVLAVHLRRGDFRDHCPKLSSWWSIFNGWNQFPEFMDKFGEPSKMGTDEERLKVYLEHCLPTVDQVLAKLRSVKRHWEKKGTKENPRELKRVYLLTNAEEAYRNELKIRLLEAGWEHVSMSFDMLIHSDEVEVDMAADMMIAQQAEVFIGNGFSSLTSNVNLLRMAGRVDPDSIRFW